MSVTGVTIVTTSTLRCLLQVLLLLLQVRLLSVTGVTMWLQARLLSVKGVTIVATSTPTACYRCYYRGYKYAALSVNGVNIVATSSRRYPLQVLL